MELAVISLSGLLSMTLQCSSDNVDISSIEIMDIDVIKQKKPTENDIYYTMLFADF